MSQLNLATSGANGPSGAALRITPYEPDRHRDAWDELVRASCNGTFLHTRRYLSYHESRFVDRSVVAEDQAGRLRAVFPAADDPAEPGVIASHPGITYGGLVHDRSIRGAEQLQILESITDHYRQLGATSLHYKRTPYIYHALPADDDSYALFRLSARRYRCDLSATIDLERPRKLSKGRRALRSVAERNGITVHAGWEPVESFWRILERNLQERHAVAPVHTSAEILHLADLFPENIVLLTACAGGELIAGGVLFCTPTVVHMQYTGVSDAGRDIGGLDVVVEAAISLGVERHCRFFDYGISTERGGLTLNEGLYKYKLSFGAGGVVYEQFEVGLR